MAKIRDTSIKFLKNNKVIAKCNDSSYFLLTELSKKYLTVEDVYKQIYYDIDAKKVCKSVIECGFGNHIAKYLFCKQHMHRLTTVAAGSDKNEREKQNIDTQFKIAKQKTKGKKRMNNTVNTIRKITGAECEKKPSYKICYSFYHANPNGFKSRKRYFAMKYFRLFSDIILKQLSQYEDLTNDFETQYAKNPVSLAYLSYFKCDAFKDIVDRFFGHVENEVIKSNSIGDFVEIIAPVKIITSAGDKSLVGMYKQQKDLMTVVALTYKTDDSEFILNFNIQYIDRADGYCNCEKGDIGYNQQHKCCGEKCDWIAPVISVVYLENISGKITTESVILNGADQSVKQNMLWDVLSKI